MEQAYAIVFTTVDAEDRAHELACTIIEARLAACVQIEPIRSIYRWKGEMHDTPEWRLAIKTQSHRYAEIEHHIKAHHAYETPEIVRIEIAGGSREYLSWIDECLR